MMRLILLIALLLSSTSFADDPSIATRSEVEVQQVEEFAQQLFGNDESTFRWIESLQLYEVTNAGTSMFMHPGTQDFVVGSHYVITDDKIVNQSERMRGQIAVDKIRALDANDFITFGGENKSGREMYVFTDVDCGYCRKLHADIESYIDAGLVVHYLAWPRSGLQGDTAETMVSVWCSSDRQQAMSDAKAGRSIAKQTCDNPVKRDFELGQELGIRGTPFIVLSNGDIIAGYVNAQSIVEHFGKS